MHSFESAILCVQVLGCAHHGGENAWVRSRSSGRLVASAASRRQMSSTRWCAGWSAGSKGPCFPFTNCKATSSEYFEHFGSDEVEALAPRSGHLLNTCVIDGAGCSRCRREKKHRPTSTRKSRHDQLQAGFFQSPDALSNCWFRRLDLRMFFQHFDHVRCSHVRVSKLNVLLSPFQPSSRQPGDGTNASCHGSTTN